MKLRKIAEGAILEVHVKPNSKEFQIKCEDDKVVLFCRETPVKGKVNRELIKELSRIFKRRVKIVSGFCSRQKKILIRDIEAEEVSKVLDATML